MKWEVYKEAPHRLILLGDGFYISYNPQASNYGLGFLFGCPDTIEETALVRVGEEKNTYYILNGDFRDEYEKLFPIGFEACYEFYLRNKEKSRSWWSTD